MSVGDLAEELGDRPGADLGAAAGALLAGLLAEPWGQVSASVYETGRLVTLAPWLTGQDRRIAFLLAEQRPDGGWGAPDPGYALVPTLSATEALLGALDRDPDTPAAGEIEAAVARALGLLRRWLDDDGLTAGDLPDMPAIELIVPALAELINDRLPASAWPLPLPDGLSTGKLDLVRALVGSGAPLPDKLHHALEIAGDVARHARAVRPESTGTVGASPAATAAWLGDPGGPGGSGRGEPERAARGYLEEAVRRYGGPVAVGLPVTVFERAWVLSWLLRAGVEVTVPAGLADSLGALFGPSGTPAAAGLPADADTTAGALYALALLDRPQPPDVLRGYDVGTHFCTWQGEDGHSVTTNAHVLEAFGAYAAARPDTADHHTATIAKVAAWLREQQQPDGSWLDRWHVSPCYATSCAAIALSSYGGPESRAAVARAVRWLLAAQRPDGSWGRWDGTAEETAYAVQTLRLTAATVADPAAEDAAARGGRRLLLAPGGPSDPPLWHDKDLYRPAAITRAAELAALHLTAIPHEAGPQYSTQPDATCRK